MEEKDQKIKEYEEKVLILENKIDEIESIKSQQIENLIAQHVKEISTIEAEHLKDIQNLNSLVAEEINDWGECLPDGIQASVLEIREWFTIKINKRIDNATVRVLKLINITSKRIWWSWIIVQGKWREA